MERAIAIFLIIACPLLGGCAAWGAKDATDPLYARLLMRENRSWQALSQSHAAAPPISAPTAGGSDIPYVGPPVEPPLPEPDLGLIPEDVPFEPPLP